MLIQDPAGRATGTPPHAASAEHGVIRAAHTEPSSTRIHSPLHHTLRHSHDRPHGRRDKEDGAC
ncbi:hypothetical protein [Streptomyces sp. NPDC047043]|uniref:hypothetical protein n=1 Tax=Streptomyces sp. NPDC047043 TaxID=3154497 RepID=UPI00340ED224